MLEVDHPREVGTLEVAHLLGGKLYGEASKVQEVYGTALRLVCKK